MRLCWLKLATLTTLFTLPVVAQNGALSSPPAPPPVPRPVSGSMTMPVASVTPKSADASKTVVTAAKPAQASVSAKSRHGKSKKVEVAATPEPVAPPPPPPTPEQMQANPPQVSYLNGQLAIQSTNATLSSILNAIRQQTGAQIEIPPGSGNERVATRVGPGPACDVIASLLSGSAFDFLIMGNPNQPGGVQRIILTAKSRAITGGVSGMNRPPASPVQSEDNNNEEEADSPEPPPDEQQSQPPVTGTVPPPPAEQQPAAVPGQPPTTVGPQQQPPGAPYPGQQGASGPPQVKTPEQMLQELQKLAPKQQ